MKNPKAKRTIIAREISAKNRWCLTGTPFERTSIEDLIGQLQALHACPWSQADVFESVVQYPFQTSCGSGWGFGNFVVLRAAMVLTHLHLDPPLIVVLLLLLWCCCCGVGSTFG